jgi:hypothetical protein
MVLSLCLHTPLMEPVVTRTGEAHRTGQACPPGLPYRDRERVKVGGGSESSVMVGVADWPRKGYVCARVEKAHNLHRASWSTLPFFNYISLNHMPSTTNKFHAYDLIPSCPPRAPSRECPSCTWRHGASKHTRGRPSPADRYQLLRLR